MDSFPCGRIYLKKNNEAMRKTKKGCMTGLAVGTIYGTVMAIWKDVPFVERKVALPGLIRTLNM